MPCVLQSLVLLGMSLAAAAALAGEPVVEALARPSITIRHPEMAAMLGAALAGSRIVAVGERGLIVISDDRGDHWRQVASPVSVTLTTVRFADSSRGVVVGHGGSILTTADGGLTWTLRLDGRRVAQIALESAKASGVGARLKEAERLVAEGPDKPFLDVAIWDERRILAVGAYGLALFSADGGATWQSWMDRLPNPRGLNLYVLQRQGNAVLIAGEQGLLLRSEDAGTSFRVVESPYRGSWFAGALLDAGEWVLVGLRGNAWRSMDSGVTWTRLSVPMPASITAIERGDDGSMLFASQSGHVLRRDGDRLVPVTPEPLGPLTGLLKLPGGRLFTLGFNGIAAVPAPR